MRVLSTIPWLIWVIYAAACQEQNIPSVQDSNSPTSQNEDNNTSSSSSSSLSPIPAVNCKGSFEPPIPKWFRPSRRRVVNICSFEELKKQVERGGFLSLSCPNPPTTIEFTETLHIKTDTWIEGPQAELLIFSGRQNLRLFTVDSGISFVLERITLKDGYANGNETPDKVGGAIYRGSHARLLIRQCHFQGNRATSTSYGGGGAIFTEQGGLNQIEFSRFQNNQALNGGAIYSGLSNLIVYESEFENNQSSSVLNGGGGAIFVEGALAEHPTGQDTGQGSGFAFICGNRFYRNTSSFEAGAAWVRLWGQDKLFMLDNSFYENEAARSGGAARVNAGLARIIRNSFTNNEAKNGYGGGLLLTKTDQNPQNVVPNPNSEAYVESCLFYKNKSSIEGGGISSYTAPKVLISWSSFIENRATELAGAIAGNYGSPHFIIEKSLFLNNICDQSPSQHCQSTTSGTDNWLFPAHNALPNQCGASVLPQSPTLTPLSSSFHQYVQISPQSLTSISCPSETLPNLLGHPRQSPCYPGAL